MPTYEEQKDYWESIRTRRPPDHPAVRAFAEPKVKAIVDKIGGGHRMLEVGAGSGHLTAPLSERFELTALDFSDAMLRLNPLPEAQKVQGDAEHLPFADDTFDVVLCANLLHHLEDPTIAVREMKRVARKHVVLLEPNIQNVAMLAFGLLKSEERGSLKFTSSYLKRLGTRVGLKVRYRTGLGAVVPNKTPPVLLPVLKAFDLRQPFGFYNLAIFDV